MKKRDVIKSTIEFNDIIKKANFVKNDAYVIYYRKKKQENSRYGISVGTKIGKAVIRNKYKRKIRMIITNIKKDYSNSYDYIIIMRKSCLEMDYLKMIDKLNKLMKKIDGND